MDLVIIGAGGHAKVVIDAVRLQGSYNLVGLVDELKDGEVFLGYPLKRTLKDFQPGAFLVAIGDNQARQKKYTELISLGWQAATVIHPSSVIAPDARVGPGTVIFAGVLVNPATTIGANCIINTGATIDHDCSIADHVHIAPGSNLAGEVRVGEGAFLGIGSSVIPKVSIGPWATVGAGGVVLHDVETDTTVVGVPARPLN